MPCLRLSGIFVSVQERFEMRDKLLVLAISALVIAGCSSHQSLPAANGTSAISQGHHSVGPDVRQTGENPVQWRRFFWGSVSSPFYPTIIAASDGNLWFDDYSGTQLIRMNMTGGVKRFPLAAFNPTSFVQGHDGKFYLGDANIGTLDILTSMGVETKITIPSGENTALIPSGCSRWPTQPFCA